MDYSNDFDGTIDGIGIYRDPTEHTLKTIFNKIGNGMWFTDTDLENRVRCNTLAGNVFSYICETGDIKLIDLYCKTIRAPFFIEQEYVLSAFKKLCEKKKYRMLIWVANEFHLDHENSGL